VLTQLSSFQCSLIIGYRKCKGVRVRFLGIDADDLPVITFTDARGEKPAFAIHRESHPPTCSDPVLPIRWFTEYELDNIEPDHHELLTLP
jgi:hypothetical protein